MSKDKTPALKLPAASFSGPAKDDIINALGMFFGAPSAPEKLADYTAAHAATYAFPDAYAGQSTALRDTMINLIIQSPQDWQTGSMLPFQQIEGTTVEWDELRFDVRLMQRVPYEGVSRMQTSIKRKHRDRIVRRGLGMMIESDFYATPAGQRHFQQQLLSIRYCVQETCNFDVLFALLTCGNYDFRYDINRGLRPARQLKTAMQHEVLMYAGAQKEGLGFDRLVEEVKMRMSRYQVTPNILIVPPQLSYFMSMTDEARVSYPENGVKGQAIFEGGVAGFEGTFRGLNVVRSMPFETTDESDAVQMLQRQTQVGEFYYIGAPDHPPNDADVKTSFDTVIFDEDRDVLHKISFMEVLMHLRTMLGGNTDAEIVLMVMLGLKPVKANKAKLEEILGKIDEESDPFHFERNLALAANEKAKVDLQKAAFKVTAGHEFSETVGSTDKNGFQWTHLIANVKAGLWTPVKAVLVRPFIEHLMLSAVASVAGADTGATLFGPSDMQLSANTSVKVIEGHYTMHSKAVVTKPQNVFVMRDILCNGYIGGGGVTMFDSNPAIFLNQLNKRLGADEEMMNGPQTEIPSMFPLPIPFTAPHQEVYGISDRILPWTVARNSTYQFSHFPGGEMAYRLLFNKHFDMTTVHYGEDQRAIQGQEFLTNGSLNNSMCFQGPHRRQSLLGHDSMALVPGVGHFGTDALPGDARWRRGQATSCEKSRSEMLKGQMYSQHNVPVFTK